MPTILRYKGFEFKIFTNDHMPPHVHVRHGEGRARIEIVGAVHLDSVGMRAADLRTARLIVRANEVYLMRMWKEMHG